MIPLATQQYLLLQRNLVYTGIRRGNKLAVVIGKGAGAGNRSEEQSDRAALFRATGKADRIKAQVIMVPGESPMYFSGVGPIAGNPIWTIQSCQ